MAILIIDDNPFFVRHVQQLFTRLGELMEGEWLTASTAEEGLLLARSARPAVILLDPTLQDAAPALEAYCRDLASAVLPDSTSLLLLHNPLYQFDDLPKRLADCPNLAIDSLAKPFEQADFEAKLERLRQMAELQPTATMSASSSSPQRFAWLSATPEVKGYAYVAADGAVVEWKGSQDDEAGHGALVYMLNLASLCGEELGFGPALEVQAFGREGSALTLTVGAGAVLNVLGSSRANMRAISTRAAETPA